MTKQLIKAIIVSIVFACIGYYLADHTIVWYKSLGNLVTPKEVLGWYLGFIFFSGLAGFYLGAIIFQNK